MQQISSFEKLADVMSNLHDCPFDLDRASYDPTARTWVGMFLRPLWEDPRAQHRGLPFVYTRTQLPLAEATLKVAGVTAVEVSDDQGIGRYSFEKLTRTGSGLRLHFNETMYLDLQLSDTFEATYEEQSLVGHHATYRQLLFLQTGPEISEDIGA